LLNYEEFEEKFNNVLRTGNKRLLSELKEQLTSFSEPICFELIAYLHTPHLPDNLNGIAIKNEYKRRLSDVVEANYYRRLAFQSYKTRAEAGNYDYMSRLAELYISGVGTEPNKEQGYYWLNKLYLYKTGMKYDEWLSKNA
jgi:hypothetical protein